MKIGVDIRVLMDEYYSGISEYTANLLSALLSSGKEHEYKLFYNSWKNLENRLRPWSGDRAQVLGTHYPNKIFNYFLQKIFKYPKLDQALGGVDIFWSPHLNFSSFSKKAKKIITVHDLSFLRYPDFFSGRKNFWHSALAVKKLLGRYDHVVAVSENTKNDLIELVGLSPEKISVIYSGNNLIRREVSDVEANEFFKARGISGRYFLFLGNIEPRKNIGRLITAYNEFRSRHPEYGDLKLILAGAPGWKNKQIYEEAIQSPFKTDIIFLGYISQKEKEILYSRATIFTYPSLYEGFGFPPLEAMTYGVPVVCSNVSSLPEVVGDAALTINPYKPEEITQAWEIILGSAKIKSDLIAKGLKRAELFSWSKAAPEYLKLFSDLTSK